MTTTNSTPTDPTVLMARLQEALALHQQGRLAEAKACYGAILRDHPQQPDGLHLLGVVALQSGDAAAAAELIGQAIAVQPDNPDFYLNRATALRTLGQAEPALACYDAVLRLAPNQPQVHYERAVLLKALGRMEEALASYDRALALRPDYAEAHNNRGNLLLGLNRPQEASDAFKRAVTLQPGFFGAHVNRGAALFALGQFEAALASFEHALTLQADFPLALLQRGNTLLELGRFAEALQDLEKVVAVAADAPQAWYGRGRALKALGRTQEALASYDRALALQPSFVEAHVNRGNLLLAQQPTAALASYDQALQHNPDFATAHACRGNALLALQRFAAAIASYDRALALAPGFVEAHNNRGNALFQLDQVEAALASYEQALAVQPDYAEAWFNRGGMLARLRRHEEATASFERVWSLQPDYEFLLGSLLHSRMQICDWRALDRGLAELAAGVEQERSVSPCFHLLGLLDAPAQLKRAAALWSRTQHPDAGTAVVFPPRAPGRKIRLGYFSADFREHPVAQLTVGLFEHHDRDEFEVIGFAYGPPAQDAMRQRLEKSFDHFFDVARMSDQEIANLAREQNIDIAVDLGGYTQNSRPGIFAQRAAPMQVSYIGFLGTMAAPFMDYLIADRTLIPTALREHYSEKIVYLPWYQANEQERQASDRIFTRAELGLPETGVVFACFNNQFKITPAVFDTWMRILQQVPDSVLYLLVDSEVARRNLRAAAEARSVRGERVLFAGRLARADYLARYRSVDLFLDTWPCNAGTTASDALAMGVPLLTYEGQAFAARIAASVLQALQMPELITTSPAEYEQRAVALARDPAQLAALRQQVAVQRQTAPLFDTPGFTRYLEAAFRAMQARAAAGLAPEDIEIRA